MTRQRDLLDLTETAYQQAASPTQWAAAVATAARPLLDHGAGTLCQIYKLDPPSTVALHVETEDEPLRRFLLEHDRQTERRPDLLLPDRPGLWRLRDTARDRAALEALDRDFEAFGFRDMLHVTAVDGTDQCVMLAALVRHERRRVRHARCWPLVAAHLAAALRLQRRYGDLLERPAPDSAILEAAGKVAHAEGRAEAPEAIERLRHAAREIDRARAVTRRHDDALALQVWEGLVAGTWSLVDRHDHDGRRYVVAVPNDPEVPDPRGLSMREAQIAALAAAGQTDKLIAYTLGLGRSTVATHLARAMRKLGVSTRVELARAFRAKAPAG
jgi:DNA-binding CsgD family transcriptional regulator